MRRRGALLALSAAVAATGCGLGEGAERPGDGATLRVTRDFGREALSSRRVERVREDQTVMRLLREANEVRTRFGGAYVQAIDGLEGEGPGGTSDWFYFVNGIEADVGAAEYELSPGDVVQWDHRDWGATMDVRAIVGAFPEPFLHGVEGKRRPVRVECEEAESAPCRRVKDELRDAGVPATGSSLGASGTRNVIRVVVATWGSARDLPSAGMLDSGPRRSGVFARFDEDGDSLQLLDERGRTRRDAGPGAGLVAALRPTDEELLWLVVGGDATGVRRAAEAFEATALRDAFAVAATPKGTQRLPLEAGP